MTPEEMEELRWLAHAEMARQQFVAVHCTGRRAFASYSAAASDQRHRHKNYLEPYHCRVCQKWHLGSHRDARRGK